MQSKNAPYCTIGFQDQKLRLIGIPLISFIMPIVFFDYDFDPGKKVFWLNYIVTLIHVALFWHIDRGIVIFFRKKFPYFHQYKRRLIYQFLVITSLSVLIQELTDHYLYDGLWAVYLDGLAQPSNSKFLMATFFITLTILSIYESMYAFDMWKAGISDYERLKKENIKAQLDTLKNQVNPHFLFNSLNTLATLIPEDSDLAVEYVIKLSKVYRFVLEIKDEKLISLQKELAAIEAYQFLLKIRFGENIQFSIDIPEAKKQFMMIPLSIQMLIENAVKHNIVSKNKPLFIKIFIEGDFVIIKNNLQEKKVIGNSTKTGLSNIEKRYDILTNKKPIIMIDNQFFIVKLPLLSIETA